jgi:alanine racemase
LRAEISTAALRGNLARIREQAPASRVLAVVKANAYGHGLVGTVQVLAGADGFAVARLEEAAVLRGAGVRHPILLLEGVPNAEQLMAAARLDLQIVVHEVEQIALLEQAPAGLRCTAWLKINTGMNRLGFREQEFAAALARLRSLPDKVVELRLMTHFALAEEPADPLTVAQIAMFARLSAGLPNLRSLANSAAIFALPATHAEWVRPGIALYGASPFAGGVGADLGLTPAMKLLSTVIAVRDVPAGETVGYGGAWRAPRDSRVAIIAAGYADGLFRATDFATPALVRGRRARLAGRVSMDMAALDVTGIPAVRPGDEVVLFGPELPVEEVAGHAGTIGYELLCAVSQRVPRVMV